MQVSEIKSDIKKATAVDNFIQKKTRSIVKTACFAHIEKYIPKVSLDFIEKDVFSINQKDVFSHPVNIYFYDAGHTKEDQKKAFVHMDEILDDVFIAVVDNWNWPFVQSGTKEAFSKLRYKELFSQEIFSRKTRDENNWWSGLYVGVLAKT